jgi:hypothetical protein
MRMLLDMSALLVVASVEWVQAADRVASDDRARVEFRLDGHLLTATILPNDAHFVTDTAEELQGRLVTAACGTRLAEERGRSTNRTRRWPRDRTQLKYWLRRDLSAHVRWCVLETGKTGGDVAGVTFTRR